MAHQHHPHLPLLTRRTTLLGMGAALSLGSMRVANADIGGATNPTGTSSQRLVVVNIKGGLDGLSALAPYGDPYLSRLRASLMAPMPGAAGGLLDLGGFFGLHPTLTNLHAMFVAGEALAVHAVGNADSSRSHFQGQDYLQAGEPQMLASGWLNRLASLMPVSSGALQTLINMGLQNSLLVQGRAPVAGWTFPNYPKLTSAMTAQIGQMCSADPLLGPAAGISFADGAAMAGIISAAPAMPTGLPSAAQLAWVAGELLAAPAGPRIASLVLDNVDTHSDQVNRLNTQLPMLDLTLAALKASLGPAWASTVVLTMTEFGRTAAVNGTGGTDHGTGFAVFMAGGAVAGGRVLGTWPGLSPTQLYQGRDLQPLVDFRQIAASVLSAHLGASSSALAQIFPAGYGSLLSGLVKN